MATDESLLLDSDFFMPSRPSSLGLSTVRTSELDFDFSFASRSRWPLISILPPFDELQSQISKSLTGDQSRNRFFRQMWVGATSPTTPNQNKSISESQSRDF